MVPFLFFFSKYFIGYNPECQLLHIKVAAFKTPKKNKKQKQSDIRQVISNVSPGNRQGNILLDSPSFSENRKEIKEKKTELMSSVPVKGALLSAKNKKKKKSKIGNPNILWICLLFLL